MSPLAALYFPYASTPLRALKEAALYFDHVYCIDPEAVEGRPQWQELLGTVATDQDILRERDEFRLLRSADICKALHPNEIRSGWDDLLLDSVLKDLQDKRYVQLCARSGYESWSLAVAKISHGLDDSLIELSNNVQSELPPEVRAWVLDHTSRGGTQFREINEIRSRRDSYTGTHYMSMPFVLAESILVNLAMCVGSRTLLHIRSIFHITKVLLEPRFVLLNDPSVQKAKDEHLDELRSLIEYWRNILVTPTMDQVHQGSLQSMREAEKLPLFTRLKEHLPHEELWITYNKYNEMSDLYLRDVQSLGNTILNAIRKWKGVQEVTDIAFRPIFQHIIATGKGNDTYSHRFTEIPASPEGACWLAVNGYDVLRAKGTESLQKRYARYSWKLVNSSAVAEIILRYTEIIKLENRLKQYLEDVLLRRDYVFHSCAICPDGLEIGRTGSRSHVPDNTRD